MSLDVICLCVCLSQKICKSMQFLLIFSFWFFLIPFALAKVQRVSRSRWSLPQPQWPSAVASESKALLLSFRQGFQFIMCWLSFTVGSAHFTVHFDKRQSEAESNEGNETNETRVEIEMNVMTMSSNAREDQAKQRLLWGNTPLLVKTKFGKSKLKRKKRNTLKLLWNTKNLR